MKVEIYGIPESLHNCYGCIQAQKLLTEKGIEYTFYPVLKEAKTIWALNTIAHVSKS